MSVQAIKREETYVDPYTAELFASYDNVLLDDIEKIKEKNERTKKTNQ